MDSIEWLPPKGDKAFYSTDAYTNQAIEYIQNHDQVNPFFLYLSFTAPHWPLHAWPEDIQKYHGKFLVGWDHIREQRCKWMI